jgi:hypothetical protein
MNEKDLFNELKWLYFYKGKDGSVYMKAEFKVDIKYPKTQKEAMETGMKLAREFGLPHTTQNTQSDGSILYFECGTPNKYEQEIAQESLA